MLRALAALAPGAVALAGSVAGAQAQSIYADEIRGGLYWHSADSGDFDASRLEDVNVELLFAIPTLDEALAIGRLRPHVGATINFGGLESMVYGGISWTVPIGDTPFFVEAAFGGTVRNARHLEGADKPYRNLGCSVMFHGVDQRRLRDHRTGQHHGHRRARLACEPVRRPEPGPHAMSASGWAGSSS